MFLQLASTTDMASSYLELIAIATLLINVATHAHCSDEEDELYSDDDVSCDDEKDEDCEDDYGCDEDEDDDDDDACDDDSPSSRPENPTTTEETCASITKSTESNCHTTETPEPECSTNQSECAEDSPSNPNANPDDPISFCLFDNLDGKQLFNYVTMSNKIFMEKQESRDERGLPRLLRFNWQKDTCLNMNNRYGVYGWMKDICAKH